jgi:retron-type reverse transcriptase
MGSVVAELEHLSKLASADPTKRFSRLYRLLRDIGLLAIAADRVRSNTGGRTAGIDGQTRKQIDLDLLSTLADELATNRYRPQPVRRVYIPKGTTGRRALGIPTIRDRIVQAAVAQVLEALYEPIFRACSHGFRPKQSTIHALRQLAVAYHAGATWTIEGDLVKCFDSIPHRVILDCLRKRIKDERFLALIARMLRAGVFEDGRVDRTYSGTPQGGLASPILSNIVLHEFDCWMEDYWHANPAPETAQQRYARTNPEYQRHTNNLKRWRAQLAGRRPLGRQTPEVLRAQIQAAFTARKGVPSVFPRRHLAYCRYADDYAVVLCQYSKAEAQDLKRAMALWLEQHLGLTQHPDKTCITHWDTRFRFLGYDLRGQRNPNGSRWLQLRIPPEKERGLKGKLQRLCGYTQIPEHDLVLSVNALARGWANYYRYAHNASQRFASLRNVVYWLTAQYLSRKHRYSLQRMSRTHYGIDPQTGQKALYITGNNGANRVYVWNKAPRRLSLFGPLVSAHDVQPVPLTSWAGGRSYEQRQTLLAKAEGHCQHCGQFSSTLVVHHPRRLSQVTKRAGHPTPVIHSGQEQHVKLLCPKCHQQHHPEGWRGTAALKT